MCFVSMEIGMINFLNDIIGHCTKETYFSTNAHKDGPKYNGPIITHISNMSPIVEIQQLQTDLGGIS